MANCGRMTMNLNSWRGYSAYEIAVQNGFEGSEEEWLKSLEGEAGKTTSVNGVEQVDGEITLTGDDINVSKTDKRKLSELAPLLGLILTEDSIDLNGRYIDNALFR